MDKHYSFLFLLFLNCAVLSAFPINAFSATTSWSFTTAGNYTVSSTTGAEVAGGVVRLKNQGAAPVTPGANTKALYHLNLSEGKELALGDLNGVPDANLKGLWHFNENAGASAADASGNGNTVTFQSTSSYTPVNISNPGSPLSNYQVKADINTQQLIANGWMRSDCNDIRFKADTNPASVDMSYWIESGCNTASTVVWVKVPSIPTGASSLYLHYGNGWTTSLSDGSTVFDFFDDFTGASINSTNWPSNSFGANATLSGGILTAHSTGAAWQSLVSSYSSVSTSTMVLETKYKTAGTQVMHLYFHETNNRFAIQPYLNSLTGPRVQYRVNGGAFLFGMQYASTPPNTWYIHQIKRQSSTVFNACTYDGNYTLLGSCSSQTQAGWSAINFTFVFAERDNINSYFDWVRVRSYAAVEPTVTILSSPVWASAGKFSSALSFDGVDDKVNVGTTGRPTNTFTVEAWVNVTTSHEIDAESTSTTKGTSGQRYLFGAQIEPGGASTSGAGLSVGTNGISVYENAGGYMPPLAVYSGALSGWNHIAVVYNNKTPSIYLNGVLVRTGLTSPKTTVYAPVEIGGGSYGYFPGLVDEVVLYNTSLSATTIKAHYERGIAMDAEGTGINTATLSADPAGTNTMANNGMWANAVGANSKLGGQAISFDGVDDKVTVGSVDRPTNTFTIEAWVYPTATHQIDAESTSSTTGTAGQNYAFGAMHMAADSGAGVSVGTNGISVYEHGNAYMPPLAVYSGTLSGWNHIAIVYYDKTPSIYLNGTLVRTGLTSPKTNVYAPLEIGGGTYGYFAGYIDEVAIYKRPLSLAEIQTNCGWNGSSCASPAEITGKEQGLVGLWHMNEGSGTTSTDFAGDHGEILGPTSTAGNPSLGEALSFDGVDDYVSAASLALATTNAMTTEFWAYNPGGTIWLETTANTNTNTTGTFIATNDAVTCSSTLNIEVTLKGDVGYSVACYSPPSSNTWHHYAAIYDKGKASNEVDLYIDGILQTPLSRPHNSDNTNNFGNVPFYMASRGGGASFASGKFDEVAIWNTVLSAATIAQHASQTSYSTTNLTVVNNTGKPFASLTSFAETLGAGNSGLVKYQVSNNGINWYYYNGANWIAATGFSQTNTAAEINTNIASFVTDVSAGTFYFKAFLNSDGSQAVEVDQIDLGYMSAGGSGPLKGAIMIVD
ncbi:MAG: DUF2341 domain-containing protein [Anaerolineae bacterium]